MDDMDDVGSDSPEEFEEGEQEGGEQADILMEGEGGAAGMVPAAERITSPYMTKYEKARIIGTRALQISMNAPITVELDGETDPLVIAEKELYNRSIPFIVRRWLPNGNYEDWPLDELIIED
eukprot:GDKI01039558.1.p2 GENE.GDKI01039558.1~~GDKI01039558.1.p2  ORF type:complete len:122 (-),score=39.95 GDKI01039558.1:15-380(-)